MRHKIILAIVIITCLITSVCIGCNTSYKAKSYSSSKEALKDYSTFLEKVKKKTSATISELLSLTIAWKALDDSVRVGILRDTCLSEVKTIGNKYYLTRDSIQKRLMALTSTKERTLSEYYDVAIKLSQFYVDSTMLKLKPSINSYEKYLDSIPIYNLDTKATIIKYESILDEAIDNGFHQKTDITQFLEKEDKVFRSFLYHLSDLGDISLQGIREKSDKVIAMIIKSTQGKHPIISPKDGTILLTMRTNRRLTLNAVKCLKDINAKREKVASSGHTDAYLWMMMQPWTIMQGSSFALLTEKQEKQLEMLSKETPEQIKKMKSKDFLINIDILPTILIKSIISNL